MYTWLVKDLKFLGIIFEFCLNIYYIRLLIQQLFFKITPDKYIEA